ncbi:unnamed protein product, partial [Aphanomyces euteiches]
INVYTIVDITGVLPVKNNHDYNGENTVDITFHHIADKNREYKGESNVEIHRYA